jgi:hypothetical protein
MAQLGGRRQDDQAPDTLVGSGQSLYLESCSGCGVPLTIIADTKPEHPLCDDCAAAS